jgi:hypothetical protein
MARHEEVGAQAALVDAALGRPDCDDSAVELY